MARSVLEDIESLPHWARVAFAARCGRNAMPLFRRFWPNAQQEREESLEHALHLAEQAAAKGRVVEGLKAARIQAVITAGVALRPVYGMAGEEPGPVGEKACHIASFVAKVAEWAAKAAQDDSGASANAALEAYTFCRDAADTAEAVDLVEQLPVELTALCRVAARGRWSDNTSVPPSVFASPIDGARLRPWWRFW